MKKQIVYILFSCITLVSCSLYELDNQDPPKSEVYGNLVYNGQVVPVKNGQIPLNFYQDSYKGNGNFQVMPSQDGKINALLFDGEYKIILASNQGAYEENATPYILNVKGKTELNWEITPFFFVNKATYNYANKQITAKVDISKISQTRDLEFVSIIVSKSIICDRINKEKEFILNASDISNLSDIHITGDLSDWKMITALLESESSQLETLSTIIAKFKE